MPKIEWRAGADWTGDPQADGLVFDIDKYVDGQIEQTSAIVVNTASADRDLIVAILNRRDREMANYDAKPFPLWMAELRLYASASYGFSLELMAKIEDETFKPYHQAGKSPQQALDEEMFQDEENYELGGKLA